MTVNPTTISSVSRRFQPVNRTQEQKKKETPQKIQPWQHPHCVADRSKSKLAMLTILNEYKSELNPEDLRQHEQDVKTYRLNNHYKQVDALYKLMIEKGYYPMSSDVSPEEGTLAHLRLQQGKGCIDKGVFRSKGSSDELHNRIRNSVEHRNYMLSMSDNENNLTPKDHVAPHRHLRSVDTLAAPQHEQLHSAVLAITALYLIVKLGLSFLTGHKK